MHVNGNGNGNGNGNATVTVTVTVTDRQTNRRTGEQAANETNIDKF